MTWASGPSRATLSLSPLTMTKETTDPHERNLGRYVLYDEIARGGMGAVHLGRLLGPAGFRKLVAIKRMSPLLASDPDTVRRFQAEAAVSARVLHPSVVSALDVGAEQGELFLVMELVRGESLARLLTAARERGEPVPSDVAAAIMTAVLSGLHAAHDATDEEGHPLGLVHCDVSPQNILVGVEGLARIADFGIARSRLDPGSDQVGRVRGKARYLAPEQLDYEGAAVDRRADVFAAAAVLWEMLAGRALFEGTDTADIIERILSSETPSVRSLRSDVSPSLDAVLGRALARSPADRYPTAAAFSEAIEVAAAGLASQRTVAGWIRGLVADRVERLDTIIRHVERLGVPASSAAEDDAEAPTILVDKRAAEGMASPAALQPGQGSESSPTRTFTVDVPRLEPSVTPAAADRALVVVEAAPVLPRRRGAPIVAALAGIGLMAAVVVSSVRASSTARLSVDLGTLALPASRPSASSAREGPGPVASSSADAVVAAETSSRPLPATKRRPTGAVAPSRPPEGPRTGRPYVADRP